MRTREQLSRDVTDLYRLAFLITARRDPDTTSTELEQALLAIDVFPRCALLLTVYEGLSQDVAAILMDTSQELVRKAQILGLWELTRNLAKLQGWIPSVPAEAGSYAVTREVRYA